MSRFVGASGVAGAVLFAFVSSPSWAVDLNQTAITSSAAIGVAEASIAAATAAVTAAQPAAQPAASPIVDIAVPAPVAPAASAPAPAAAAPAAPARPQVVAVPVRPQVAAATPPAPAPVARGFSAFFPRLLPASATAAVSAVAALPGKLGGVISRFLSTTPKDAEHECLATAVYYESKSEPLEGQLAVAQVVLNRAASGRYPASVCGVVKQRAQFSFVRRGRLPQPPRSSEAWQRAVAVAEVAREKLADSVASNALAFHATYVAPGWKRNLTRIARIGAHIFYR